MSYRISDNDVESTIGILKLGKAAGPDSITCEKIKTTATVIMPILKNMFNHILTHGSFPHTWPVGIITPIHKKGSLFNADNYRASL